MVIDGLMQALQYLENPYAWLMIITGVVFGLVFGIIPGLGGLQATALLLPFIFVMKPEHGLPLLMAISSVGFTGGSMTAILINVPGTGPNAATMFDGFPMAQKGQAGRAIGAALGSSAFGGTLSGLLALAMIPLVIPMVMAIGTGDMVFIILVGLSFIGILGGHSKIKGLISGGLGLMISFMGFQALTGIARFTFNSNYLYDGFGLVPVSVGLFAIPEMITLAISGGAIAKTGVVIRGLRDVAEGVRDVFRHWSIWLRSSVLGYIIGIVPGVGAEVATFVAYGQAKQTSKDPSRFGTGVVEGVIAPESANNAKEGGALLTTLALGIPGSAIMAMIIGAMYMLGITPGPEMLTTRLPLAINLMMVIIIANILGAGIAFLFASRLAKVAFVPGTVLVPIVMSVVLVAAFVHSESYNDIIVALVFGGLGVAMRRFGYSRPALFLGYVLGYLFENYFFIALGMGGPWFFVRPISLSLVGVLIILLFYNNIKSLVLGRKGAAMES